MVSTYLTRAMKGVRTQVTRDFTHLPAGLVVHGALQRGWFAVFSSTVHEDQISMPALFNISVEKS